ncbi:hypothetical protein BGX38DRAFT_1158780, partial [Terfezia claveryi]
MSVSVVAHNALPFESPAVKSTSSHFLLSHKMSDNADIATAQTLLYISIFTNIHFISPRLRIPLRLRNVFQIHSFSFTCLGSCSLLQIWYFSLPARNIFG